jgi:putative NADH-flavin reductase
MKLLIIGATGPTGKHLVAQALEKSHHVTALVRSPEKLKEVHPNLEIVVGNVLDATTLSRVLQGKDAVLSALGVGKTLKANHLMDDFLQALVPAMNSSGVGRLIFLSAFGVGESFSQANFLQKLIFKLPLKSIYADKERGERFLKATSKFKWTIVRPVVLTNGPRTGKYKAGEEILMKGLPKISRADVADFMLKELDEKQYLQKCPVLSE